MATMKPLTPVRACTLLVVLIALSLWRLDYRRSVVLRSFIENRLTSRYDLIEIYCTRYQVNPALYASVIAGELLCNWNELDLSDDLRAAIGADASLGFGQMRLSTANWLEQNYASLLDLSPSASRLELLERLRNDTTNIQYTVVYIHLIQREFLSVGIQVPTPVQLGSWYARGIDRDSIRIDSKYVNSVGRAAGKYFSSSLINR